jgi:cobalt-zinc-cadmium efflux system outer membrane protein
MSHVIQCYRSSVSCSLSHRLPLALNKRRRQWMRVFFIWSCLLCHSVTCVAQEDIGLRMATSVLPEPNPEQVPIPLPDPGGINGLTLESVEQLALGSNPSVQRAAAMVAAAGGNWVQVGLAPNPSVGYEGQQIGSGGLAEQHGVLFSQEIVRGGKLRLNRAVAGSEQMRLEQELAAQQQRVLTDVRIAFYQVLLAQRQIDLTQNLIRISGEGSRAVDSLFRSKEVGRTDVLQAQLETENAQILRQNAQHRYDSAWQSLSAVIGDPNLPHQVLVGDAEAPPKDFNFDQARSRLLALSPELASASMAVQRARAAVDRERVEPIPNVTVQGLVNWQDNGIGGKPDGGLAVSIPIPVFNRNQGGVARAQQELVAASRAVSQLELDLQNRLAPVFERYANARNQVTRYRDVILPAADESLGLTRKTYTAGESNYTTLLTAQRTFSQTQLGYLEALRALRIAEIQIDGLLLSGSLESSPTGSSALEIGGGVQTEPVGAIGLVPQ